jgi:hypothetical protein
LVRDARIDIAAKLSGKIHSGECFQTAISPNGRCGGCQKIDVIPHGLPDIPSIDPNFNKDQFGVEGKTVLLTFGLLSPL